MEAGLRMGYSFSGRDRRQDTQSGTDSDSARVQPSAAFFGAGICRATRWRCVTLATVGRFG